MDLNQLLSKLQDDREDGPLSTLCALVVDDILDQPLKSVLEPERLAKAITATLSGPGIEPTLSQHIKPSLERFLARAEAVDERLGVGVPESVAKEVEDYLSKPLKLKPELAKKLVDAKAMKDVLSMVVQESLRRFLKSNPDKEGKGGSGGLMGLVGRGAGMIRDVGKGMLGGLGDEIERQIQKRSKEAMEASMSFIQEKLVEYLLSEDTAKLMGKGRAQGFRRALRQRVADAKQLPLEMMLSHIPALVRHNLARPEIQVVMRNEIQSVLALEGEKSLRQLLTESGVLEQTRADVLYQATTQARRFVKTEKFTTWLGALFTE